MTSDFNSPLGLNTGPETPELDREQRLAEVFKLSEIDQSIVRTMYGFEISPDIRERVSIEIHREHRDFWCFFDFVPLFADSADRLQALTAAFMPDAPLFKWGILQGSPGVPIYRLNPKIRAFLAGADLGSASVLLPVRHEAAWQPENSTEQPLHRLRQLWMAGHRTPVVFRGADAWSQKAAASWLAAAVQRSAFLLNIGSHNIQDSPAREAFFREIVLEAALLEGVLVVNLAESAEDSIGGGTSSVMTRILAETPDLYSIVLPSPTVLARYDLWRAALQTVNCADEAILEILATSYIFTREQIEWAVKTAALRCESVDLDSLIAGCRSTNRHDLSRLATRIDNEFQWDDLMLAADTMEQLRDLADQMRLRTRVFGQLGYTEKRTKRAGIAALFAGPPGTGKTMAASVLANSLKLELYRIDLSAVISKYVGETEKNLNRIFNEAHRSNAVLLFDEADAVFGKRSEVKDAHDRYANIEVAYLLQKVEEYEGLTILSTNMLNNIDEAFRRRLNEIVEFFPPDSGIREKLWRQAIARSGASTLSIDIPFLSERLRVTGAEIENIVLRASFYAARDEAPISMQQIMGATRREFQKEGRSFLESDFHPYAS
jgi:DNA polymerase III delta prime subunit